MGVVLAHACCRGHDVKVGELDGKSNTTGRELLGYGLAGPGWDGNGRENGEKGWKMDEVMA